MANKRRRPVATIPAARAAGLPKNYDRAVRLYDATPSDLPDLERLAIVLSVCRMLNDPAYFFIFREELTI